MNNTWRPAGTCELCGQWVGNMSTHFDMYHKRKIISAQPLGHAIVTPNENIVKRVEDKLSQFIIDGQMKVIEIEKDMRETKSTWYEWQCGCQLELKDGSPILYHCKGGLNGN